MSEAVVYSSLAGMETNFLSDVRNFEGSRAPFAHPEWVLSSIQSLGERYHQKFVYLADRHGAALAPLCRRQSWFGAYQQLGVSELGEPGELLFSEALLDQMTDALAANRIPLNLHRVPATSPLIAAVKRSYCKSALILLRSRVGCPYITLSDRNTSLDSLLSSTIKRDLRRARKRAEAMGTVAVEIHSPKNEAEFRPLWEQLLDIEALSWKGETGTAMKADSRILSFYENYTRAIYQRGELRIFFLCIDGRPIAMQLVVVSNNCFWLLKIGYNAQYSKCSPGMLLMYEAMQYAKKEGLESYEFMGYAKAWTRRWTLQERPNLAIFVYPYTVHGMALLGLDLLTSLGRRIQDILLK